MTASDTSAAVAYVGGALVGPMAPFLVMSSAPPQKAGAAGSLASTAGELGVGDMPMPGTRAESHRPEVDGR